MYGSGYVRKRGEDRYDVVPIFPSLHTAYTMTARTGFRVTGPGLGVRVWCLEFGFWKLGLGF